MLDLIRVSALPSHQMMSASKGALRLPAQEMVEILVHLAEHSRIFGEQARLTLAAWDEASAKTIAADPHAPKEVLDYWISPKNIRPALFPLLIENPSVPMTKVAGLASSMKGEWIDIILASPRVRNSRQTLTELSSNKELSGAQSARVQQLLGGGTLFDPAKTVSNESPGGPSPHGEPVAPGPVVSPSQEETAEAQTLSSAAASAASVTAESAVVMAHEGPQLSLSEPQHSEIQDPETEGVLVAFLTEHAQEIAAEPNKPFQPIGGVYEEHSPEAEPKAAAAVASASPAQPAAAPPKSMFPKKLVNPQDEQRGSVLQKVSRLDIKGRIQLAMKGTKEERSLLIRDGTKIVALAVLDSPKISDGEVEKFASQKNVLEAVLRAIPMKRRFAKNYAVVRNLVFNPRTPLDVSLGLMKNLLVQDLRNLSGNKEVAETVRKLALRMFKQKSESNSKK
jgi:hypothetical protein